MMPGGMQVAQRCYSCGTAPAAINPPAFPGPTNLVFTASATIACTYAKKITIITDDLYCNTAQRHYVCTEGWDSNFGTTLNITLPMTGTISGSYLAGVRYYTYTRSSTATQHPHVVATDIFEDLPDNGSGGFCPGSQTYTSTPTETTYSMGVVGAGSPTVTLQGSFNWLAVAQRDIYGIRIKRKSGTDTWLFSCTGGQITIENESGTKLFSTSGTFNDMASAINASSISSEIEARATYMWTNAGEQTSGTIGSWNCIISRNDLSTMLKNLPRTRLNTSCTIAHAPTGYSISSGFPVYQRGETLPPRGVVSGAGPAFLSASSYFFNNIGTNLSMGTYPNDEPGALQFVQAVATWVPNVASTSPWILQGISDSNPGAPNTLAGPGLSFSGFSTSVPVESASGTRASRIVSGPGMNEVKQTLVGNYCSPGQQTFICNDQVQYSVAQTLVVADSSYCCNSCGGIDGPQPGDPCFFGVVGAGCQPVPGPEADKEYCCTFGSCVCENETPGVDTIDCCGATMSCDGVSCSECSRYFYERFSTPVDGGTIPCYVTTVVTGNASWRIG